MYMTKRQKDINKQVSKGIVEKGKVFHKNFEMIKKIDEFMMKNKNSKTSTKINFPKIMDQVNKQNKKSHSKSMYHSFNWFIMTFYFLILFHPPITNPSLFPSSSFLLSFLISLLPIPPSHFKNSVNGNELKGMNVVMYEDKWVNIFTYQKWSFCPDRGRTGRALNWWCVGLWQLHLFFRRGWISC